MERFYEPSNGEITLDDQNIQVFDPTWYRSQIGFVSQEPTLFACTIRDNITFGCQQNVEKERIIEAAKLAYAHEFIESFPNGYETIVGERGVKLSGGLKIVFTCFNFFILFF